MRLMSKLLKKTVLSLLLFLFLVTVSAFLGPHKASAVWYNQPYDQWHEKVYNESNPDEIFGERYTAAQVQWILYSLLSNSQNGINDDASNIISCGIKKDPSCMQSAIAPLVAYAQKNSDFTKDKDKSLLALIFEDRPISAISYFRNIAQKTHLVPEAKAQGFGYTSALTPILDIWKITRNVSYTILVLVVLVMAFMIMFRVKISPQVVITVQSALPKVVIAIILVTFSYAIAGLIIDLMYVFIGLTSLIISQVINSPGVMGGALSMLVGQAGASAATGPAAVFSLLTKGFLNMGVFGFLIIYWIGFLAAGAVTALAQDSSFMQLGLSLFVVIAFILLILILLYIGLKIIWVLFKTLANVFLLTIVAPLQIVLGVVIPSLSFDKWLISFVSNIAVFPVVGAMLMLSLIFLFIALVKAWAGVADVSSIIGFIGNMVPFVGTTIATGIQTIIGLATASGWPPLLSVSDPNASIALMFLMTSFVIMTTIPKTVELIQSIIKGQAFNYGAAIGEAVGAGTALPRYIAGQAWGTYSGAMQKATQEQIIERARQSAQARGGKTNLRDFLFPQK